MTPKTKKHPPESERVKFNLTLVEAQSLFEIVGDFVPVRQSERQIAVRVYRQMQKDGFLHLDQLKADLV